MTDSMKIPTADLGVFEFWSQRDRRSCL